MYPIETAALSKRFRRVEAVQNLNLQVAEGAVFALMGPNGAGKTTLIKLLMNLLRPNSGHATMLGNDARGCAASVWNPSAMCRRIKNCPIG